MGRADDELTVEDWRGCLRVLRRASRDPSITAHHDELKGLVAKLYRRARKQQRRQSADAARATDRATLERTTRCQADPPSTRVTEPPAEPAQAGRLQLLRPRRCYVCKELCVRVDAHYHMLCRRCARENHRRRTDSVDLTGRVALVTGGRVKIGFETALRLLRSGAHVVVTTRFPQNAVLAYAALDDASLWADRLEIIGIDLRLLPRVEQLAVRLDEALPHLDILVNNAAQTIHRPPGYYAALLAREDGAPHAWLPFAREIPHDPRVILEQRVDPLLPHESSELFPFGETDAEGQPVDLRPRNSWTLELAEVATAELLEAHLVTTFAPFVLCARLREAMTRSPFPDRYVVNVSAMEGVFARETKTTAHPHTNMAKAAMNMITRTSAADFARSGIFMNSVDTGWITQEHAAPVRARTRERGFVPPLDVVDGAARVYAPIADGVRGRRYFGQFLKDYRPHDW